MIIPQEKIAKAKESLGDRNAEIMAELLGLEAYGYKEGGRGKIHCCFHQDDTPSMVYNAKNYTFHCFGCQKVVDVIDCLMIGGKTFTQAVEYIFEQVDTKHSFGEVGIKTKHRYRYPKEVKCASKENVYKYLDLRKISKQTVDYADVREDSQGNIVFNYYDTNDVLTLVKYRPSRKVNKGENKSWCQKDADTTPLLFNMNRVNTTSPLLITEGEIDCLTAIEAGYLNAVSVPLGAGNYGWIEENWDWLEQFDSIIICADNDEAGIKLQKEANYRLGSWRTKIVDIPHTVTLPNGSIKQTTDLNQILYYLGKEAVLDLIINAKESPVDSVSDFSDIRNIDLNEIDGITTGIHALDKPLMRLFYGTFTIITGVNGSGKSSFLSQLICRSMDENKNAWLFSGELPNFQSKNWINYILAGQRYLNKYAGTESDFYKVTAPAQRQIDDFYKGRLFIYKDGYSNKVSSLLKSMEDTVRKYGAKLLIIDNLTAVNLENNDKNKYEKQGEFVQNLISFAKKYNVAVILVVHPHKLDTMRRMNKMDVQGISAIIDLAHRILSLYRVTPADKKGKPKNNGKGWYQEPIKCDVICDILKDRMMGYEGGSAEMYYDKPSRRFFVDERDLDHRYRWDTVQHNSPLPFPPPQLAAGEHEVFGHQQQ